MTQAKEHQIIGIASPPRGHWDKLESAFRDSAGAKDILAFLETEGQIHWNTFSFLWEKPGIIGGMNTTIGTRLRLPYRIMVEPKLKGKPREEQVLHLYKIVVPNTSLTPKATALPCY